MDFDGDGRLDLLSGSHCCDSFGFHVIRSTGKNRWAPRQEYHVNAESKFGGGFRFMRRSVVSAADWDGDGIPDLLWQATRGIGVARGPFPPDTELAVDDEIEFSPRPMTENEFVSHFAVADWDRDGKLDLLVHLKLDDNKGGIYVYRNLGERGLKQLAPGTLILSHHDLLNARLAKDGHVFGFCVSDWDGDGWPDLVLTRSDLVTIGAKIAWQVSAWLYKRES